ncbi:MAG: pyridoxamine 5'-phosphate oxidase family protein [Pikeienuella sp.]
MADSQQGLHDTLDAVWVRLQRGVTDRAAPARHPVLATTGRHGFAEARLVVLRGADRRRGRLEVHTDRASAKVVELVASPGATLLVWDAAAQLQIRLRAWVEVLDPEACAAAWALVPDQARAQYGGEPLPGRPIAAPDLHQPAADGARFAALDCAIAEIETLQLGPPPRRALFTAAEGWCGRWLVP